MASKYIKRDATEELCPAMGLSLVKMNVRERKRERERACYIFLLSGLRARF